VSPHPYYELERKNVTPSSPSELREQEKEQEDWTSARERLRHYGVAMAHDAITAARSRGWTTQQINELLDRCEAHVVNGVKAWTPGLVCRHLQTTDPGAAIALKPSEEYRRELGYFDSASELPKGREQERQDRNLAVIRDFVLSAEADDREQRFGAA